MSRITKYLPILALVGAVSLVGAQTADPVPPPAAAPAQPGGVPNKMTSGEMITAVVVTEAQIQDDGRKIMHLKEISTRQKDVIKLTCLNDKLIQFKAQLNIWDSNKALFQASLTKTDDDRVTAYGALMDGAKGIRDLREQANACVGEPELFKQESGVEVSHPPFPDDPTADDPFDPGINDIEPPGYASPFF
jgi:hypothetical protein